MDRLSTPARQRLLASPLGAAAATRPFEWLKTRSFPRTLSGYRARAAADVALGSGPAAYLREADAPPAPHLHDRIETALARYADAREAYEELLERWEAVFWGDVTAGPDQRVELERERRRISEAHARPDDLFGFLARDHYVPPVKYDVPDPDAAAEKWARELADPERLYGFSDATVTEALPRVTRSATVAGPGTTEFRLRFETPALHVGDTATARVYEPDDSEGVLPTFVFYSEFASLGDSVRYWPEEEAVGRRLARAGYRVVLPDAPWHARREPRGSYSGEPALARAPVGLFELSAAAAKEAGVLVDWARTEGAPRVGVGGVGLGGTVALHVAGRCDLWPESMCPEFAAPVGAPDAIDQTIASGALSDADGRRPSGRRGSLGDALDLGDALSAAGWTGRRLREFSPLLDPPTEPALDPERILVVCGSADSVAPAGTTESLVRRWRLPRRNVTRWDCGHVGVRARLLRGDGYQRAVTRELDRRTVRTETSVTA